MSAPLAECFLFIFFIFGNKCINIVISTGQYNTFTPLKSTIIALLKLLTENKNKTKRIIA